MRNFFFVALAVMSIAFPARSQHGMIDANESLFTAMAAINAAGYDADLDSPSNHPLRKQVRAHLAAKKLSSVERLKTFYEAHDQHNWVRDLSQYISFALVSDGPAEFGFSALDYTLPPDIQALEGLGPLLSEFYAEADIASLYQQIQPAIDEIAGQYQAPVSQGLFEINGYLRNPTSGVSGRSFNIVLSLLAAPNQIQTRSYSSNYAVVVTPSAEPQVEDVLYTYLHYVLEPVAGRAAAQLERIRPLGDYALGAPHLPAHYKQDFQLLATSSLIKAIQARLARASSEERQAMVERAYRQGYVLAPAFAEQLPAYEKQAMAMRLYFREMVEAVDLSREEARAQGLEFEQQAVVRKAERPPEPVIEPTQVEKTLEEAEEMYRGRDLEVARDLFLRALRESDERPAKAKAYYGLARTATLQNDPELAVSLFERALTFSPEPRDKAWIFVYLGRLSDVAGDTEQATGYYRNALTIEELSDSARAMAEKGAAGAFRRGSPRQ